MLLKYTVAKIYPMSEIQNNSIQCQMHYQDVKSGKQIIQCIKKLSFLPVSSITSLFW